MNAQRLTLTGILVLALLAQPAATPAAPGDEFWAEGFNFPGINASIYTLAPGPDGSLYAGGDFTTMGRVTTNYIARWDGARWHPLGSGMNRRVAALVSGPDGLLYAAGDFSTAGGVAANHIARWDGSQWHPLGSGMDRYGVYALAFGPDGSLYAGGWFNNAGGVAAPNIARWDGFRWHPLGSGMGGSSSNTQVTALAVGPDGSLYAGGIFSDASGVAAANIARWDGAQWHPLGSGMDTSVSVLRFGPDGSLYAGGGFTTAGGAPASRIARWDGSQWHPLGSGMAGVSYPSVQALAVGSDGSLYAGGYFTTAGGAAANYIARWDGSQWRALSSGLDSVVLALAFTPTGTLYAGGVFTSAGGVATSRIARWDGAQWHAVFVSDGNGMNSAVTALAAGSGGSVYAAGNFTAAGGVAANRIARWDGAQWRPLGSGITGVIYWDCRSALAVGPDGSLYAGGCFNEVGGVAANGVARWDGTQWHPLGSGMVGYGPQGVFALAFGPDGSLYAGGNFANAGGTPASNIARWDGSQWHPLGSGVGSYVFALAFGPGGSLYAGGSFTYAGGVSASRIARWDGSQWHPLGSGMGGTGFTRVEALAIGSDGSLYAAGSFMSAGGVAANSVARWDGAQWHPHGSGTSGEVWDLAVGPSGSLYAGGYFTTAGGVPANNIARWDGAQWHALGSGINSAPYALAVSSDGSLYAGGWFSTAGGKPSSRIARWTAEQGPPYVPNVLAPIEQPPAGAMVSGIVTLRGYAIDRASVAGTGIDAIHIYLDGPYGTGTIIGGATYGLDRPDIAAQYGERYRYSGWELAWNTAGLAPGVHRLYLYAHRTTDNAWSLMDPHLVVVPGGPARWLPIILRQR